MAKTLWLLPVIKLPSQSKMLGSLQRPLKSRWRLSVMWEAICAYFPRVGNAKGAW